MRRFNTFLAATASAALLLTATACSSGGRVAAPDSASGGGNAGGKSYTIAMITHEQPGTAFWDRVRSGAEQAAKQHNITLKYSNDPDQSKQATLVQNAVDSKVDGIAATLAFPDAVGPALQKAAAAGIPTVAAAARKTVVVVNAATPVLMPWRDQVDAILWAGLPGQEGGHAVAAALLGEIEPAGRLVTTFPTDDAATPAWSVTPVDGKVTYDEGTFIGYRGHYAGRTPAPAFWLGHGLGYLTNTGERASREVVQVYFQPVEPDQPVRLVGWQAVEAAPGESVTADVATNPLLWRRWDADQNGWSQLSGTGELLVARGLGDIQGSIKVEPGATG
jgi:hypothetical protein